MTQVNYKPEKSGYSQELKGLGIAILLMVILAAVNSYADAIRQFLNSSGSWTMAGFVLALIVVLLVIRMYRLVTLFKTKNNSNKQS